MGCFSANTNTKFQLPSYVKAPSAAISAQATKLIGQPFVPYTKPMVAGMSTAQTDAMAKMKALLGGGALPRSIDDVGAGGSTSAYMNPYLQQVLSPILRQLGISTQQQLMGVDAKANMAGAFGDKGHALERAETSERGIQAGGDATAKAYADAYNNAMGLKTGDINRIEQQKNDQASMVNSMFNEGTVQQKTAQAGLDAQMSEFLRQQGWSVDQLGKLTSIIGSLPTGTAQTTTTPSTASSVLGGAAGVGSILASLPMLAAL